MSVTNQRFWQKVDTDHQECWLWQGALDKGGYGLWSPPKASGRRMGMAHRFAYEDFEGTIPEGFELDHLCRIRNCVNPLHLEPVTPTENMRRVRGQKTHCPNGHELDAGDNRYVRPDGFTYSCRSCQREIARRRQGYYERRGQVSA